jgi:hypothetical protein
LIGQRIPLTEGFERRTLRRQRKPLTGDFAMTEIETLFEEAVQELVDALLATVPEDKQEGR